MEKEFRSEDKKTFCGIFNPVGHPTWYYVGEWEVKTNEKLQFKGLLVRLIYNGMATRSFSFLPVCYDMGAITASDVTRIDSFQYDYIIRELNNLFTDCKRWIEILPENNNITYKGIYEEDDNTYKSAGVIYNEGTIYISKELRWNLNWEIEGSYYERQHISYYKAQNQEASCVSQDKDFEEYPAINDFYGFTTFEFSLLHNSSKIKKISKESYDLLLNAFENRMHWIYRSIQAANRDIKTS